MLAPAVASVGLYVGLVSGYGLGAGGGVAAVTTGLGLFLYGAVAVAVLGGGGPADQLGWCRGRGSAAAPRTPRCSWWPAAC